MITDYTAQVDTQQRERELAVTLERRRVAAERAAMQFDGDRLALIAHLARAARTTRVAAARPVSC
jgi:hypothetical protein